MVGLPENGQLPKLPGGSVQRIDGKTNYEFLGLGGLELLQYPADQATG